MSGNKVFPIRSDTACLLKWSWSTVFFNSGTSASCHRTQKYPIDPDNFDQFHNLPDKIRDRNAMIRGEWPGNGCEYCRNTEAAGGQSDRLVHLSQENQAWITPPELANHHAAVEVTPTILEVYFKNTCNMACVYCGAHFSSLWAAENNRFKETITINPDSFSVQHHQHNTNYDKMVSDFWRYLAANDRYKTIKRYHILGGEPFLLDELDDSIEFWKTHPNPDLIFEVITNLNIPTARFQSYIKKIEKLIFNNKIWKLQLTASLDGWGNSQTYVRYGLDLDLWQENFEFLLNKPWISLSINSVVSAITVKSLPSLIEKIIYWNSKQQLSINNRASEPIIQHFGVSRHKDHIYNFDGQIFNEDFKKILELMPEETKVQRDQKSIMSGIALKSLQSKSKTDHINDLKQYLDQIDRRRRTNWREHFPWLDQDFSSYET